MTEPLPEQRVSPRLALSVSVVVVVLVVAADLATPMELNFAIFKCVALLTCALARSRRYLWGMCAILIVTTFSVFIFKSSHMSVPSYVLLMNRVITACTLALVSIMLHLWITADIVAQQATRDLRGQNEELAAREEEIQRQNEELQSTTEELERQSEELRVINEELAQRERMTETLLDLSRSLHVGLDNDATLMRICETLAQLVNGPTIGTAILMHDGGVLKTKCQYGFGPAGLKTDIIALERSFAALVLEQARTGYIEDLALRPDLDVPQPKVGEPIVSVLSTPLVVQGKPIGTIELYSRVRRHWTEEQTALIESLAAQTSISLENAQLFEELDRGKRRLATILEHVPVGLAIASVDLRELRLNAAGAALLGQPPDTNIAPLMSPPPWQIFQDGEHLSPEKFPIARAVKGERVFPTEIELIMPTSRRLTVLVSATPFYDGGRKISGAISTFVDITQLKQLQRELETRRREAEEASVRKTRFLAAASHDIRTPANAISLLAELLKRTADNPSMAGDIPQLAEELRASATSLVNLVSNILDVTRFDTDKLDLHESEFSLAQLLEEEIRQVLPLAQAKRLVLDHDAAPKTFSVRADRIKLGRVIGNLLGNAIKFTDNGGVRVRSGCDGGGSVEICVSDTGIGISPENQSHIFDEFWQLSDPARSKGSGLGLAISKRLVQAMGGNIEVTSTIGEGSTFRITLPATIVAPRGNSAS
jgi:signal transduction histidine kinase